MNPLEILPIGGDRKSVMTLDDRRRLYGLSVAELARRTGLGYDRTWRHLCGSKLEAKEIARIERVVAAAERERQIA
jgi:hypothetical protein